MRFLWSAREAEKRPGREPSGPSAACTLRRRHATGTGLGRLVASTFAFAFASTTMGCDRAPSSNGLPEWTAQDHDRKEEAARTSQGQAPSPAAASGKPRQTSPAEEAAQLAELTWSTQCIQCHGPVGKGDGPNGATVKAPDLTRAEWQDRVKDADMTSIIQNGKGQMPRFELSDAVTSALVKRIRKNRAP